jgi:integrase
VATKTPTVANYTAYWLAEIVQPNLTPGTYVTYEATMRLYVLPYIGKRRLDRLNVDDVQKFLNALRRDCQCCKQERDKRRRATRQRCCALGKCCHDVASPGTVVHVRRVLRIMINRAIRDGHRSTNPTKDVTLPSTRSKKKKAWTSDEARQFLESARADGDPYYAAYVLVLVLGLRKGEMLGIIWDAVIPPRRN